jgi:hypothetical protein
MRAIKNTITIAVVIGCLASCVFVELHDADHPEHGKITALNTDWTDRDEGVDIPAGYTVQVGDYSARLSGPTNAIDNYFPEGTYTIHIWNEVANINTDAINRVSTANYTAGETGWLFTGSQEVNIEKEKEHAFTVVMHQQVRLLTLELEITGDAADHITEVDATLSGITSAINITNGNPTGETVSVTPAFIKTNDKYTANLRLLGIQGNAQILTLTLHFDSGNASDITAVSDLSEKMTAFNANKAVPFTLKAGVAVKDTALGVSVEISDWEDGNSETVVAE